MKQENGYQYLAERQRQTAGEDFQVKNKQSNNKNTQCYTNSRMQKEVFITQHAVTLRSVVIKFRCVEKGNNQPVGRVKEAKSEC